MEMHKLASNWLARAVGVNVGQQHNQHCREAVVKLGEYVRGSGSNLYIQSKESICLFGGFKDLSLSVGEPFH